MKTRIAIDLNDVIRDYTDNFIKNYLLNYNREFDTSDFSIWTNDMETLLPFKTRHAYENFVYEDYSYELYGKCDTCTKNTQIDLNSWLESLKEIEDNEIDVMFVSPMEYGPTIGYTYFFISKLNTSVRRVYLPKDSSTIWDECDILITANPMLLNNKPEGKTSIKIEKEYNQNCNADYSYKTFSAFTKDENNILNK